MPYFTLWLLDFFNTIWVSNSLDPDQAGHFVGPDLVPNCLQRLSADNKMSFKLFAKVITRQQKSALACKEVNTKLLVETTFWLKPWLKFISFGSNFFHMAKVLDTANSEPELALIKPPLVSNDGSLKQSL